MWTYFKVTIALGLRSVVLITCSLIVKHEGKRVPAWSIASQKQKHFVLKVFLGAKAALGNERFLGGEVSENETS